MNVYFSQPACLHADATEHLALNVAIFQHEFWQSQTEKTSFSLRRALNMHILCGSLSPPLFV